MPQTQSQERSQDFSTFAYSNELTSTPEQSAAHEGVSPGMLRLLVNQLDDKD